MKIVNRVLSRLELAAYTNEYPLLITDTYDLAYTAGKVAAGHWEQKYRGEWITYLNNSIMRAKETIREHGRIRDAGFDVQITLCHLSETDVRRVALRGDHRYSSEEMAEFLRDNPKKDLLPIQVGKLHGSLNLLDGHHRWRAYLLADRPPLVLLTEVIKNIGDEPMLIFHVKIDLH